MIQYILLGYLQYGPMTGYDLKQNIDQSTGHFWHAYHSQIYTTLRQMEKDGSVSSQYLQGEGQPDRRVYTITVAGRQVVRDWLDQAMTQVSPVKEELLVRIFFSAGREKSKVVAELLLQRELHQRKQAEYRAILDGMAAHAQKHGPGLERDAVFWSATLRLGLRYETAYLEWLNETIATVENLPD